MRWARAESPQAPSSTAPEISKSWLRLEQAWISAGQMKVKSSGQKKQHQPLAGMPRARDGFDAAIRQLFNADLIARGYAKVFQYILAQRDLAFGGDGERAHLG